MRPQCLHLCVACRASGIEACGSFSGREKYEELRKLKDEAEENTIFSLQKKKGYAAEKKQVREQKEEAERFNGKLEQLKVQQQEYYLFQLFNVHQEMSGHQEKIDALEEAKEETQAREATAEDRLKSAKKTHAKLNQLAAAAEKVHRPPSNESVSIGALRLII